MGEKIGQPLYEETGRPRVLPKTMPLPKPQEVPQGAPEKDKEKVHAQAAVRESVSARAYRDTETAIRQAAKFLGISEQQVANMIVTFADRILRVLNAGTREKATENPCHSLDNLNENPL